MASNRQNLKQFVRIDGSGRVVAGSNVWRKSKPKNGNWTQILAYECCDSTQITTTSTTTSA